MKNSVRSGRFTMGMVLFLIIILLLSVSSAYYLNRLSGKTNAILKENHYSVVFARDMTEELTNINLEIINCFLTNKNPDTLVIYQGFQSFDKTLESEKNNLTEPGEDKLVSGIETDFNEYHSSVLNFIKSTNPVIEVLFLQEKFDTLYQQLMLLSQMNENAIEEKTDDAKVSATKFTLQMTFIGTLCFLIAYGFSFSFSSYFNERFITMYEEIKEIVKSNYSQRLKIDGNDEIREISLIFNEMAEKLSNNKKIIPENFHEDHRKDDSTNGIQELKNLLIGIKSVEEQTVNLISRLEKK